MTTKEKSFIATTFILGKGMSVKMFDNPEQAKTYMKKRYQKKVIASSRIPFNRVKHELADDGTHAAMTEYFMGLFPKITFFDVRETTVEVFRSDKAVAVP